MKIRTIELENFGPFYGNHKLELWVENSAPVVLIYGENMRGKTTLLSALKWCLYGQVVDRRDLLKPSFRFINLDAIDLGEYHMSVTIEFEHEKQQYSLLRQVQADHHPRADSVLNVKTILRRDGHFVANDEILEIVGNMLHEDIARFFLFDGEMLGHYEILLSEPGREVELVKESIEQILGLPAIQMMVKDLEQLKIQSERRQLRAVKAEKKNEKLVAETQQVSNELDAVNEDISQLRSQLTSVEEEQELLKQRMEEFTEIKVDARDLERLEDETKEKTRQITETHAQCVEQIRTKWWMPLAGIAEEVHSQLLEQAKNETERLAQIGILKHDLVRFEQAVQDKDCPTCNQPLEQSAQIRIADRLQDAREKLAKLDIEPIDLAQAIKHIDEIHPFVDADALQVFMEKEVLSSRLLIDQRRLELKIENIRQRLRGHDVQEIRITEEKYERCIGQRRQIEVDIEDKKDRLVELQIQLSSLNKEIQRLPGADPRTTAETTLLANLEDIFRTAVDRFRDTVRHEVELEATNIFRMLTTEPDYDGLAINDQYGLSIRDNQGRSIVERSMGAEQIVALSLIGALNRCSVREGPTVMDTPFGRLDLRHRKNILGFVPTLLPQVILLVQSGEFYRDRDLQHLGDFVGREYLIVRDGSPTRSRFEKAH